LAERFGAKLTLAHFWEPPAYPYTIWIGGEPDMQTLIRHAAEEHVWRALGRIRDRYPQATSLCRMGAAWHGILAAAAELNVDLIVMGGRSVSHAGKPVLGAVTEKVMRLSPVPVLVTPGLVSAS
jgi:hypothetical protein